MSSVRWVVKKSDDGAASTPKTPDKQSSADKQVSSKEKAGEKASDGSLQPTVKALFEMADGPKPSGADAKRQDTRQNLGVHYGGNGSQAGYSSSSGGKDWKQRKLQDTGQSAYGERTNWKAGGWQDDQWSWDDYIQVKDCHVNVELSHQGLSDVDLENLFEHLEQFMQHTVERSRGEYVVNVDLSGNTEVTDSGITHHLAPFLQKWPICHRLKLFKTSIGDRALKSLSGWVADGHVHELHLSDLGCRVTSDCIHHILKDITKKKKYPYVSSNGANCPLWLRLEHNGIPSVDELVSKGKAQGMSLAIIDKSDLARIRPGSNTTKRGAKEIPAVNLVLFRVQELRVNRKSGASAKESADSESGSTPAALPPLPFPPPPPPPEPKPSEANGIESQFAAPPPPPHPKLVEAKGAESPSNSERVEDDLKLDCTKVDDVDLGSHVNGVECDSSTPKSTDNPEKEKSVNTGIDDSKIGVGADQAKGNCDEAGSVELGRDSVKNPELKIAEKPRTGILRVLQRKPPDANAADVRLSSAESSSVCLDSSKQGVESKLVRPDSVTPNTAADHFSEPASAKLDMNEIDLGKDDIDKLEQITHNFSTQPNRTEVVGARSDELKLTNTSSSGKTDDSSPTARGEDDSGPLGKERMDSARGIEGCASTGVGEAGAATEDSEASDSKTRAVEAVGPEPNDSRVDGDETAPESTADHPVGSSIAQPCDEHAHRRESSTEVGEENKHARVGQALSKLRVSLHFVQERSVYERWEHHMRLSADPETEANRILMMMMRLHGQEYLLPTKEPTFEVPTCSADASIEKTAHAADRPRGLQEAGAIGTDDRERPAIPRHIVSDAPGRGGLDAAQGVWPVHEVAGVPPEKAVFVNEMQVDSSGERSAPLSSEAQGVGKGFGETVLQRLVVSSAGEDGPAGGSSGEPKPRKKKGKNKISSDSLWAPVSTSDQYQ